MKATFLRCALLGLAVACRGGGVTSVPPNLIIDGNSVDFGAVHVGSTATFALSMRAGSAAEVTLTAHVEGAQFGVPVASLTVLGLEGGALSVTFTPSAPMPFQGTLVIDSNDAQQPEVRVPLTGRGAYGVLAVNPAAVQFPPRPFVDFQPIDPATLPKLQLASTGEVEVIVTSLSLSGAAFGILGNALVPDGGFSLAPDASVALPLTFTPTSADQTSYTGEIDLTVDDPAAMPVAVPLSGMLAMNQPPSVCIQLVQIIPADGAPPLTTGTDVPPRAEVDLTGAPCTTDPEDGTVGLSWHWTLMSSPLNVPLAGADTPSVALRPFALGHYVVRLDVSDAQGNVGTATTALDVTLKADLLAELSWPGSPGVDLDLHFVRPDAGPFTLGDVNGYAAPLFADAGAWNVPQLNIDDTGLGPLLENISLDGPEPGTYGLYVHEFRDSRSPSSPTACFVDGGTACGDGEACSCPSADGCVADVAPHGSPAGGSGRCISSTTATLKIFIHGVQSSVTPMVELTAPCGLIHLADVTWLDGGATVQAASGGARYGIRENDNLQCAPNASFNGVPWYAAEP